jgi:hypothetical protein
MLLKKTAIIILKDISGLFFVMDDLFAFCKVRSEHQSTHCTKDNFQGNINPLKTKRICFI